MAAGKRDQFGRRLDKMGRPLRKDGGFADPRDQGKYWDNFMFNGASPNRLKWSTSKDWNDPSSGMWQKSQQWNVNAANASNPLLGATPRGTGTGATAPQPSAPQPAPTAQGQQPGGQQPAKPAGRVDARGRPRRADGGFADPRDQDAYWARVKPEWGGRPAKTPWSTSKVWNNAPGLWQTLHNAQIAEEKWKSGNWGQQPPSPQPGGQQPQGQHIRAPESGQPQEEPAAGGVSWRAPTDNDFELFKMAAAFGVGARAGVSPFSGGGFYSPEERKSIEDSIRQRMQSQEAKFGVKYGPTGIPVKVDQPSDGQQPSQRLPPRDADKPPQGSPWGQPGQSPWAQPPSRDFDYQTAFNAQGQAVNSGNIMGRLNAESRYSPNAGSASGNRAASDLQKSMLMENAAQGQRGIEQANAQQNAQEQAARSEAMQSAMSNQARMYSDATNRANDQLSLATQIQQAMMESRNRFRTALMT